MLDWYLNIILFLLQFAPKQINIITAQNSRHNIDNRGQSVHTNQVNRISLTKKIEKIVTKKAKLIKLVLH